MQAEYISKARFDYVEAPPIFSFRRKVVQAGHRSKPRFDYVEAPPIFSFRRKVVQAEYRSKPRFDFVEALPVFSFRRKVVQAGGTEAKVMNCGDTNVRKAPVNSGSRKSGRPGTGKAGRICRRVAARNRNGRKKRSENYVSMPKKYGWHKFFF